MSNIDIFNMIKTICKHARHYWRKLTHDNIVWPNSNLKQKWLFVFSLIHKTWILFTKKYFKNVLKRFQHNYPSRPVPFYIYTLTQSSFWSMQSQCCRLYVLRVPSSTFQAHLLPGTQFNRLGGYKPLTTMSWDSSDNWQLFATSGTLIHNLRIIRLMP